MPKASEVAAELRKFAACLDKDPEADVDRPFILMWYGDKNTFLRAAALMPRPISKYYSSSDLNLDYKTSGISIRMSVPRNLVCTLVAPAVDAVWECEPLLSAEEESEL